MGAIKQKYSLFDFDLDTVTRTPKETYTYQPFVKSCSLAMNYVRLACQEVTSAVTKRMEVDCELITIKMYNLMVESHKSELNWTFPDNLPGGTKFFYLPKVEGANNYNSNCKSANRNQPFEFDIIHVAVGINYKNYYSNYVRTLLINPTVRIKDNYNFLMLVKRVILFHLRDGVELAQVYESAITIAKSWDQHLAKYLKREFGYALSPIFQDDLVINSTTKSTADYGMTFSININLMGLTEGERIYNLCSSDTVLVRRDAPAEVLTRSQRNEYNTIIEVRR